VSTGRDKPQLALSSDARRDLEYLQEQLALKDLVDAYRFAVAVALKKDLPPTDVGVSRTNYIATSTLDSDGVIQAAVTELRADHDGRPYALVERLAEAGAADVAGFLRSGHPVREYLAQLADASQSD
jgi:hypothetical protein